ncbi:hypothetical protein, partial [Burkholderia sp. Ac-20344]|uniref:hypothetical protein n=1 Tax=Burkholderia sp. Ac-20344 TaxID=2703890 RepID=UPI00197C1F61
RAPTTRNRPPHADGETARTRAPQTGFACLPHPDGIGLSAAVSKDLMKPFIGIQVVSIWR